MSFTFGSPFVNQGSGRIKTDRQNERNIQTILDNYIASPFADMKQFRWSITKETARSAYLACPAIGFALGVAGSWSFVHRNSKYIGKFFTLLTTWLGWKVALKANEHYNYSKRVTNFHLYPKEIQRALDNNDFRYARQWLNEPIKEETVPVKDTLPEVAAEQDDE